jgi:hypothetical protein
MIPKQVTEGFALAQQNSSGNNRYRNEIETHCFRNRKICLRNSSKILSKNPHADVLVFAGYDHWQRQMNLQKVSRR